MITDYIPFKILLLRYSVFTSSGHKVLSLNISTTSYRRSLYALGLSFPSRQTLIYTGFLALDILLRLLLLCHTRCSSKKAFLLVQSFLKLHHRANYVFPLDRSHLRPFFDPQKAIATQFSSNPLPF